MRSKDNSSCIPIFDHPMLSQVKQPLTKHQSLLRLIGTYVLLGALVFQVLGHYTAFVILRKQNKTEIKQLLRSGNANHLLTSLTLTQSEFESIRWEEKGKEFYRGEEMYDVVSIEQTPTGLYTITCFHDLDDTHLFQFLLASHKKNSQNEQHNKTLKLLQLLSMADLPMSSSQFSANGSDLLTHSFHTGFYLSLSSIPACPPPDVIVLI